MDGYNPLRNFYGCIFERRSEIIFNYFRAMLLEALSHVDETGTPQLHHVVQEHNLKLAAILV